MSMSAMQEFLAVLKSQEDTHIGDVPEPLIPPNEEAVLRMPETMTPNVLCAFCDSMTSSWKLDGPTWAIRFKSKRVQLLRSLQTSSIGGCHLCSIISQYLYPTPSVEEIVTVSDTRRVSIQLAKVSTLRGDTTLFKIVAELDSAGSTAEGRKPVDIPIEPEDPERPTPGEVGWQTSTYSDSMYELVGIWLKVCANTHPNCTAFAASKSISDQATAIPEYLVDVGMPDYPTPRLVATKDLGPVQWTTLSHRWGVQQVFCTLSTNLASLLEALPLASLPRTFREAIEITKRLGHRYIWIDSLCIIQDSAEHWVQESAIMGDVYSSSIINIAAAKSGVGPGGCFVTRNPLAFHTLRLTFPQKTFYVFPDDERTQFLWSDLSGIPAALKNPLYERGWVVQERLLSTRTILYGERHLTFQCVSGYSSDALPPGEFYMPGGVTDKGSLLRLRKDPPTGSRDSPSWNKFREDWWGILMRYTSCSLTRGTDKLVAIDGVIREIEEITGLKNVAGLWLENLLEDLLWHSTRDHRKFEGRTEFEDGYRGPTWSWASVDGIVAIVDWYQSGLDVYERSYKAELVDVGVEGKTANGMIQNAWLKIKAPMRRIQLKKVEQDLGQGKLFSYLTFAWPAPMEVDENRNHGDNAPKTAKEHGCDVHFWMDMSMDEGYSGELWVVLISHGMNHDSAKWKDNGLVVERNGKKNDAGEGEWVRIGTFEISAKMGVDDTLFGGVSESDMYLI